MLRGFVDCNDCVVDVVVAIIKCTSMHNGLFSATRAMWSQLLTTVQIMFKFRDDCVEFHCYETIENIAYGVVAPARAV